MLNKISFKNYKIFKEKQTLEIKPITIVFGKNNSGKSAVVKLPTLIEGAFYTKSSSALNVVNDGLELGAELRDLVYGRANRMIEFELDFARGGIAGKLETGVLITTENNKQTAVIDYWTREGMSFESTPVLGTYRYNQSEDVKCDFAGLRLQGYNTERGMVMSDFNGLQPKFRTDFLGPIRIRPLRDYRLPAVAVSDKMGLEGENTYFHLIEDALTTEKKLITAVSEWYKENFEGWELKVNQDKAPLFQIEMHRGDLKQNILDTGIGMSQVLPVITRALRPCAIESLIIIEEPETHLHPAAHGNLAELICKTVEQGNKKYLIETHSLNFILRIRRLVAEGKLRIEDLALYYVDFSEEENFSSLTKIVLGDDGTVNTWPDGVFNETLQETIGIRTAQLDKR